MFECYCPCRCGCEFKVPGLCQDCREGNHEVIPEGVFPGVDEYLELHKSIVSQYERVLYTRKTFIGKLEYSLKIDSSLVWTVESLKEAEDLSDAIHIAEKTGYEINEEEDALWIKLTDKILVYYKDNDLGIPNIALWSLN